MKMNDPLISIICPVYMVGKYLERCISSIINQSYENIELILVIDEESDDNCSEIADCFVNKDKRVKKTMRGHYGLGDARNYGMSFAKGEYVIFVDSDDCLCDINYFSDIVACIKKENPDYIITRYRKYFEKNGKMISMSSDWNKEILACNDPCLKLAYVLDSGSFNISAWAKAVKTSFIREHELLFPDGYSEDIDWTSRILSLTTNIQILYTDGYEYLVRLDSLSKSRKIIQVKDIITRIREWDNRISGNTELDNAQRGYLAYYYFILVGLIPQLPRNERKNAYSMVRDLQYLTEYARSWKAKIARLVCSVFGIRVGSIVLNSYIVLGNH